MSFQNIKKMKTEFLTLLMAVLLLITGCSSHNGPMPDPGDIVLTEK